MSGRLADEPAHDHGVGVSWTPSRARRRRPGSVPSSSCSSARSSSMSIANSVLRSSWPSRRRSSARLVRSRSAAYRRVKGGDAAATASGRPGRRGLDDLRRRNLEASRASGSSTARQHVQGVQNSRDPRPKNGGRADADSSSTASGARRLSGDVLEPSSWIRPALDNAAGSRRTTLAARRQDTSSQMLGSGAELRVEARPRARVACSRSRSPASDRVRRLRTCASRFASANRARPRLDDPRIRGRFVNASRPLAVDVDADRRCTPSR